MPGGRGLRGRALVEPHHVVLRRRKTKDDTGRLKPPGKNPQNLLDVLPKKRKSQKSKGVLCVLKTRKANKNPMVLWFCLKTGEVKGVTLEVTPKRAKSSLPIKSVELGGEPSLCCTV